MSVHTNGEIEPTITDKNRVTGKDLYRLHKEKFFEMVLAGHTNTYMGQQLGVHRTTIPKWKRWLYQEEGLESEKQFEKIRSEFISCTKMSLDLCRAKLCNKLLYCEEDSTGLRNIVNALTGVIRTQMELYAQVGVLPSQPVKPIPKEERGIIEQLREEQERWDAKRKKNLVIE